MRSIQRLFGGEGERSGPNSGASSRAGTLPGRAWGHELGATLMASAGLLKPPSPAQAQQEHLASQLQQLDEEAVVAEAQRILGSGRLGGAQQQQRQHRGDAMPWWQRLLPGSDALTASAAADARQEQMLATGQGLPSFSYVARLPLEVRTCWQQQQRSPHIASIHPFLQTLMVLLATPALGLCAASDAAAVGAGGQISPGRNGR